MRTMTPEEFSEFIADPHGAILNRAPRAFLAPRFAADLSIVRVHTGGRHAGADLKAGAYSVGSDGAFTADTYSSEAAGGHHLIAHELGHVVSPHGAW
jgi:hypothetical protein